MEQGMTRIQCNIINYLRTNPGRHPVPSIAQKIKAHGQDVQEALHGLDDDGWVLMRNGFYWLSERGKR